MSKPFLFPSIRYPLALWLATVLAFFAAFLFQLEPAQWTAITVWIVFIQVPTLNYSKIIWWAFGTIVGAIVATVLIIAFNQAPEVLLLTLAVILSLWNAANTLVKGYKDYGFVLAGYTCGIVTMSALEHPDQIFRIAVTRVACIFVGMVAAIIMISLLLPKHRHWRHTQEQLAKHLHATFARAARALAADPDHPGHFSWRQLVDRLSTLEHSLDITTAESPDARAHAPQARSLVATLFSLLADAQAIEVHLSRVGSPPPPPRVQDLLARGKSLLESFADTASLGTANEWTVLVCNDIGDLRYDLAHVRDAIVSHSAESVSAHFVLDRLDDILRHFAYAVQDWAGLFGPWLARRETHLVEHKDYRTACLFGVRTFLAMTTASAFAILTGWPSGAPFVLMTNIVCALLSLVPYAPALGWDYVKSSVFCFTAAGIYTFVIIPNITGFPFLALTLGILLFPAALAYRNPPLRGSAVISFLTFWGLTSPSNSMTYDVTNFFNLGIALFFATCWGYFFFHAVPSLAPATKRRHILRATRHELTAFLGPRAEQGWTSLMFDRLRLLHHTGPIDSADELHAQENELLTGLQVGLRQRRLHSLLHDRDLPADVRKAGTAALRNVRTLRAELGTFVRPAGHDRLSALGLPPLNGSTAVTLAAIAEMSEMALLMESADRHVADDKPMETRHMTQGTTT